MNLVIPMSGLGSRFLAAGYKDPKPLISVHGRPMIEWVLRMFARVDDILFICRREHIETTPLRSVLQSLRPDARIAVIDGAKEGPVGALMKAEHHIHDNQPVLVSYCDYYMHWDFTGFMKMLQQENPAGAVPCYTGFHPHLIPQKNLYACCRVDDKNRLLEIREKHTFDSDKTRALHSPGAYYFASGLLLKTYSEILMQKNDALNGEYYVSMVYSHLLSTGLDILVPANVKYFCQWGTPEDLHEYLYWTDTICHREVAL